MRLCGIRGQISAGCRFFEVAATGQPQILFCGIREIPSAFSFSGGPVRMAKTAENKLEFRLSGLGILELMFGEGPVE